jgi:hypothetical protein
MIENDTEIYVHNREINVESKIRCTHQNQNSV